MRLRSLVTISILLWAWRSTARMGLTPAVNPKTYKSPSGEFMLQVDPSDMYGRGSAAYRVTRNEKVIWSGEKSFTLYEAGITDSGIVGGYAYSHGLQGFLPAGRNAGRGEFHVVLMRPTGDLIRDEIIPREDSRFLHTYPNPVAKAIWIDAAKSRMIVVVSDPDVNRQQDVYWTYQLSTGNLLGKSTSGPKIPLAEAPAARASVPLPDFPFQTLKYLQSFALGSDEPTSAIRDITCFDFDDRGRIGFIRRDTPTQQSFVFISPDGEILREAALPLTGELARYGLPRAVWLSGDRWILVASGLGVGAKASAWWLDTSTPKFEPVAGFDSPSISKIARSRDGGFVVLATKRFQYTMEDSLIAFDRAAKLRWEIKQNHNGGESALFSPKDVTVTSGGRVAVVDVIRHKVQFFSTDGNFQAAINLAEKWGRKPNYPSDISADKEDGIVVKDFHGSPPLVRMNAQGKVIGEFFAKHSDGRIIDSIGGIEVGPGGRAWACDGQAFIRLRDDGVSDVVLGSAPSSEKLDKIAALTVDQQGRTYAMDDRTGAVHIYNDAGKWVRVCKPDVSDFKDKIWSAQVAPMPDGGVFASAWTTRFVQFAPDGRRLGTKQFGLDTVSQTWHPLSDGKRILIVGYHDAFIVDQEGQIIRTIQRRPDRNWLEQPRGASVAPDGSFAIVTGGGNSAGEAWQANLYDASGEPIRTISMPDACVSSFFAYTGKLLVTRTDREICLFSVSGEPLAKCPITVSGFADAEHQRWLCFAPSGGRELWVSCPERKSMSRFELP